VTTQLDFILLAVAGWVNRHQQAVIEFLEEENRVLLEQLGGKPKRFTDSQRMRLARKAKVVGRHRLEQLATIVTPDTCFVGSGSSLPKSGRFPEPIRSVGRLWILSSKSLSSS
jgi:hypothetical protein